MYLFLDDIAPEILEPASTGSSEATVAIAVLLLAVVVGAFFVIRAIRKSHPRRKEA